MGNGNYPVEGEDASKLKAAANTVEEIATKYSACDTDQYDNAAYDGGVQTLLHLAVELIRRGFRE